jgi:predicted AAA+ superfamily ATPase
MQKFVQQESAFLWGARQTGKSTLLKQLFPDALYYDLLLSEEFERFFRNPSIAILVRSH